MYAVAVHPPTKKKGKILLVPLSKVKHEIRPGDKSAPVIEALYFAVLAVWPAAAPERRSPVGLAPAAWRSNV